MPDYLDFILRLLFFCLTHSLLAAPQAREFLQKYSGWSAVRYRLLYNLLALLQFGWVMLAWGNTRVLYVAPGIWSLVLYGLQFVLIWGMLACLRQTGLAAFLGLQQGDPDGDRLITTGCYRFVRHPLYLLGILFMLLNPVITGRWLVLCGCSIPYLLMGALLEERRLLRRYGDLYRQYQQQVPFLIPRLSRTLAPGSD